MGGGERSASETSRMEGTDYVKGKSWGTERSVNGGGTRRDIRSCMGGKLNLCIEGNETPLKAKRPAWL